MAAGRKRHRHTGREYGLTWLMGSGPQDDDGGLLPGLDEDDDESLQGWAATRTSRWELEIVAERDEMDESFKSLDRLPLMAESPRPAPPPTPAEQRPVQSPVPLEQASQPQFLELHQWRQRYRDEYSLLLFLQQFEPDRHEAALESIRVGRGADVAHALPSWYVGYRKEHGWD